MAPYLQLAAAAARFGQNKVIKILGGNQTRPNINIKDMIRVYEYFIENNIKPGVYNAGFENMTILDLGKRIQEKVNCKLQIEESNDPRSYRQCSDKLLKTGFIRKHSINDAINEIVELYNLGHLVEDESCYTVKWMKKKVFNG
jgi:nucleoside-diphosphate-sugar epimerase